MQSLVMSQCDCNGCAPTEGMCACPALLLYGKREGEVERDEVLTKHVNAAAERCDVRERTTTLKHWNDSKPCVTAREPPTPPALCVVAWSPEQSGMQASARPRPVSQPPSRRLVPLPPPVSRSGAHFVCSAYMH